MKNLQKDIGKEGYLFNGCLKVVKEGYFQAKAEKEKTQPLDEYYVIVGNKESTSFERYAK